MLPHFFSLPWHELFFPKTPWFEKMLRPVIVYLVMLVLFRTSAKRELAQATLFDFLVVLLIANVVQNAMIGEDNSILGAIVGTLTLVILSGWLSRMTAKSKRARIILEGEPALLIHQGVIDDAAMKREAVSRNDLLSAVRKQGLTRLADVSFAILELDGTISVIKTDDDKRPHDCLPTEVVGSESAETK